MKVILDLIIYLLYSLQFSIIANISFFISDSFYFFLMCNFCPPKPILVASLKAVHHDGQGKYEGKYSHQSTKPTHKLPQYRLWKYLLQNEGKKMFYRWVDITSDSSESHQCPPETLSKCPGADIVRTRDSFVLVKPSQSSAHSWLTDIHQAGKTKNCNSW